MARALRPLAAIVVLQWLAVLALARHSAANDAGTALAVLQVGVLLPIATWAVCAAVAFVAGERLGLVAAALWALGPFAAATLWDTRYRHLYEDVFLVRVTGLADDPGFRAAVAIAVALALTALALRHGTPWAAAGAGLAASLAAWADVSAVMALGVPALALLAARRPVLAAAALAGAVPGMVALAAGPDLPSLPTTNARWTHLDQNELSFQEYFWSMRLLQWLPLAGAIGLARRSWPLAAAALALVAGWLLVEGSSVGAQAFDGTFLAVLVPAAPAFFALASGVVLLVPPLRVRQPAVDGLEPGGG
jgi:hypothetical protein